MKLFGVVIDGKLYAKTKKGNLISFKLLIREGEYIE